MTSTICAESLLKCDRVGRVRVSEERRSALLAEFDRSYLSAQAFAELVGVRYSTFAGWIQRRRAASRGSENSGTERASIRLVEAEVVEARIEEVRPKLVVELGGGAKVEVSDRGQLALAAELLGYLCRPTGQAPRVC